MPITTIQLLNIRSLADIYLQLGQQVELPADFGCNLDALYDFLSASLAGPIELIWTQQEQDCQYLSNKDSKGIINLLEEIAEERADFEIRLNQDD